jgi:hypothetical protein
MGEGLGGGDAAQLVGYRLMNAVGICQDLVVPPIEEEEGSKDSASLRCRDRVERDVGPPLRVDETAPSAYGDADAAPPAIGLRRNLVFQAHPGGSERDES